MAFKKVNKVNNSNEVNATATFNGTLKDVFEGKTRNYATIRTMRGNYYDDFSVSFDKSYELPDGETECEVKAEISTFFDRDINRSKTIFTGISLTPIDSKKN